MDRVQILLDAPIASEYTYKGLDFHLLGVSRQGVALKVLVEVAREGKQEQVDGELIFVNPPIVHNGEYDPEGSFKEIVYQAIERQIWPS